MREVLSLALKEQDIVFTGKDADGNTIIQMPITRVENVEGVIKTVNSKQPDEVGNVDLGLANVATSGNYNDLSNRPTIPATPKAYVTTTYVSGNNGYRVWSDGYIEQWGKSSSTSRTTTTVTLPKAMTTTTYNVTISQYSASDTWSTTGVVKSKTQISIGNNYSTGAYWRVCGF